MVILVVGALAVVLGLASLRSGPPAGWPWGIGLLARTRDPERAWRLVHQLAVAIGLLLAVGGATAALVG